MLSMYNFQFVYCHRQNLSLCDFDVYRRTLSHVYSTPLSFPYTETDLQNKLILAAKHCMFLSGFPKRHFVYIAW